MGTGIIGVVNQDPEHLKLLDEALREHGYSTVFVPEGPQARQLIKSSQPDLVMLDTKSESPGNGWHLVQELRLDLDTAKIPLLILSSEAPADAEAKGPALARHQHVQLMPGHFEASMPVGRIKQMLADRPQ